MDNIYEVMQCGPIVFSDEEMGVLITVNGSYLNWFNGGPTKWTCSDVRATHSDNGLYSLTVSTAMDQAKEWFEDEMNRCSECGELTEDCECETVLDVTWIDGAEDWHLDLVEKTPNNPTYTVQLVHFGTGVMHETEPFTDQDEAEEYILNRLDLIESWAEVNGDECPRCYDDLDECDCIEPYYDGPALHQQGYKVGEKKFSNELVAREYITLTEA